jgi:transcription termination/antitermination protein NusG
METSWYVVKVLPGKERQLEGQFNELIANNSINFINRFLCPTEKEIYKRQGKSLTRDRVIYSGYLYFECANRLTEDNLKYVASISNVMGMFGDKRPVLLRKSDVERVIKDDELVKRNELVVDRYVVGESVNIIDGPFKTFVAQIDNINGDKVDLQVSIFGRSTPVQLTIDQISKVI